MSTTGITCTVYVDGERLADGAPADNPLEPTALSGLEVQWGRSTTVDQPDTGTCTFDVMDQFGGSSFLTLLRTGRRIDVDATGIRWTPGGDTETFVDGDFSDTPIGSTPGSVIIGAGTGKVIDPAPVPIWTVVGTNQFTNPAAVSLDKFSSTGGALNALSVIANFPNPETPTAVRSTLIGSGNQRILDLLLGTTGYVAATQYRIRMLIQTSQAFTIALHARANVTSTGSSPVAQIPLVVGVNTVDVTVMSGSSAPTANAGFTFIATGGVGWTLDFTKILIAKTPIDDSIDWISGDRVDTGSTRYDWTGAANASTSTVSTGSTTPSGAHAFQAIPTDPYKTVAVVFAPDDFTDAPDGWDQIPSTSPGQIWDLSAAVRVPPGSTVIVEPVLFDRPNGDRTPTGAFPGVTVTGTGGWQTVPFTFAASSTGQWVGIRVRASGYPRWVDMPGTWAGTLGTWIDYGSVLIDDLSVKAPTGALPQTVRVFSGRITDLQASYDTGPDSPVVHVTAQDFTADLENTTVGDEPWPVETMQSRFERIVSLSGFALETIIDPGVAGYQVSYQDVDAQGVTGLLQDLAQSVDGVLWAATHATTGPYLWVEDPGGRPGLYRLEQGTDGIVRIVPATDPEDDAITISSCDVLRDPVEWHQSVSDVSTRAAIGWLEQGVDDDGKPTTTDRTETVIDAGLETIYGIRRIQVSTLLQSAVDARTVAQHILARTSSTDWRVAGFTLSDPGSLEVDDVDGLISDFLELLDGTTRIGRALQVTDLPAWSPSGPDAVVFLEGGTYSFVDGAWTLALIVSSAASQGSSVSWAELDPAWRWVDMDPAIAWIDLIGVDY